jgi:ATP-dependent Lon protease
VILPAENEPNVQEDLQNVLDGIQIHYVKTADQALERALGEPVPLAIPLVPLPPQAPAAPAVH